MFDIGKFRNLSTGNMRFERQIKRMLAQGLETEHVQIAVQKALENLEAGKRAFVIYGEPQCGKTEMMITLTSMLLDKGYNIIVTLLNDNVQLLSQNLERFRRSSIDPAPFYISEILEENIGDKTWIIFCKKNINDLNRLKDKLGNKRRKIIIDDEADFASPNSKINKNERTAINNAINDLLGKDGFYIGVTATPARLDMNNTFDNLTEDWICFSPHKGYVGKETFFPLDFRANQSSMFHFLPAEGDYPVHLRNALFSFFLNVAYINLFDVNVKNQTKSENDENASFSFLIHTSGNTADHRIDEDTTNKIIDVLSDDNHTQFQKYVKELYDIAVQKYGQDKADDLVIYIISNIRRKVTTVLNAASKANKIINIDLTNPPALFTIIIGGNIISRGVTFNNLLGMFFTRDVRHKMQQDTYIQRARMFGNRGNYLAYFELWIPEQLYLDWHRCFVYHQLSLEAIKADNKAPVWISDDRIQPIAKQSIDKSSVVTDAGEMYFSKFTLDEKMEKLITDEHLPELEKLLEINKTYGNKVLPLYVINFVQVNSYPGNIAVHEIRRVGQNASYHDTLYRPKGIIGGRESFPNALHHFMVISNTRKEARIVYNYSGKVQFLKNIKKSSIQNA